MPPVNWKFAIFSAVCVVIATTATAILLVRGPICSPKGKWSGSAGSLRYVDGSGRGWTQSPPTPAESTKDIVMRLDEKPSVTVAETVINDKQRDHLACRMDDT